MSFWKKKAGEFKTGFPAEFWLSHAEVEALRDVIDQGLQLIGHEGDANYLVIRLDNVDSTSLQGKDTGAVGTALLNYYLTTM